MIRAALIATIAALALPAAAQPTKCYPVEAMMQHLQTRYGETSRGMGLAGTVIVEVLANAETGTFTIVVHRPDGMSCPLADGENWQEPAQDKVY